jgi:hypothetical protein
MILENTTISIFSAHAPFSSLCLSFFALLLQPRLIIALLFLPRRNQIRTTPHPQISHPHRRQFHTEWNIETLASHEVSDEAKRKIKSYFHIKL